MSIYIYVNKGKKVNTTKIVGSGVYADIDKDGDVVGVEIIGNDEFEIRLNGVDVKLA